MNRLPGYDNGTRRSELAVFATLGSAAAALVIFAALDGMKFAREVDSVAALWTDGPAVAQAAADQRLAQSLTNVSFRRPFVPGGQLPLPAGSAILHGPGDFQKATAPCPPHFPGDSATEFE
jgi:hypothetical protein